MHCAIDAIELWVTDLERTCTLLSTYGFRTAPTTTAAPPGERVTALTSGGVAMVLRQPLDPGSTLGRHVEVHGDTVGDVPLTSDHPDRVTREARAHGLRTTETPTGTRIDFSTEGTVCHTVCPTSLIDREAGASQGPFTRVDHVACCLEKGTIDGVARAYEAVLGLHRIEVPGSDEVGGADNGMRSIALTAGGGGLTVVLTEPLREGSNGQTQQFLDHHAGPGIQHAALACDSVANTVAWCRGQGAEFLRIPDAYYDEAPSRLPGVELPWDTLRQLQILVDGEDNGLLLQLFGLPLTDRGTFFFELIERAGASGFGGNNVAALFAAVQAASTGTAPNSEPEPT